MTFLKEFSFRSIERPRTDGLMRRIDYIRQVKYQPVRNGLNAPPGENPYEDEFGILSYQETMRLINKHAVPKRPQGLKRSDPGPITWTNIAQVAGFTTQWWMSTGHNQFLKFCKGNEGALNRTSRRKLSRVLLQLDAGMIVKKYGIMVHLTPEEVAAKPEPPKEKRWSVCFDEQGRVRISPREPLPVPKALPRWFADMKLPGEK